MQDVMKGNNLKKKYKGFQLDIPKLHIPKGFATALIGENGAGKTTLINMLTGIRMDYKGELFYFDEQEQDVDKVKERIGYTGPGNYFLPHWNVKQVEEISSLLFETFDEEKFWDICVELGVTTERHVKGKKVNDLSDGNKVKLMLAAVLARKTDCLILDEPASPLDPLMRDKLCEIIREYLTEGNGEKSVLFSTHNISDMENVTDYAIIVEHGNVVEEGFVEDLKEKYVLVKGEAKDAKAAEKILYSFSGNAYGFEGICLAADLDKLAGMDIQVEVPTLFQISVAVMKANSTLKLHQ